MKIKEINSKTYSLPPRHSCGISISVLQFVHPAGSTIFSQTFNLEVKKDISKILFDISKGNKQNS